VVARTVDHRQAQHCTRQLRVAQDSAFNRNPVVLVVKPTEEFFAAFSPAPADTSAISSEAVNPRSAALAPALAQDRLGGQMRRRVAAMENRYGMTHLESWRTR
jgi:hypothetical protein